MKAQFLSYQYKKWGFISIFAGVAFGIINLLTDIRIDAPVFAIYSGFLEKKYFTFSHTNLTDELTMIFWLTGLLIVVLSAEKTENDWIRKARYKALLLSFLFNYLLLMSSVLFVYGSGFVFFVIAGIFSQSVIYLICFYILKAKNKQVKTIDSK